MVPELSATFGASYERSGATVGVDATWTGRQFLIGDEGNEETFPRRAANTMVDVHGESRVRRVTVSAEVANVLDSDFDAFGIVSENGRAVSGGLERFLTPGQPRRLAAGLRVTLLGSE